MYEIKKILVPVDFSDGSRAAFDRAMALAKQVGARVTVYHVAEVSPTTSGLRLMNERGHSTVGEYTIATARGELEEFLKQLTPAWGSTPEVRVDGGAARERILREAENGGYDLLVMGTHGRTGRTHALAGSVTESVVRSASCPVLTVRE